MLERREEIVPTEVSIVIPAFNEEGVIGDTLNALREALSSLPYEVIVVDNGSTDDTGAIAVAKGAKVLSFPDGTIAAVRNHGVQHSHADVLVFLDADVSVTRAWGNQIASVVKELQAEPMTITGSRCLAPEDSNILNRHWFSLLAHYDAPYMNSGHLITSRALFDLVGGFSEALKTAEDYDFCMKAKKQGAKIVHSTQLPVIHYGYPTNFWGFIKREKWHGRQDFETLQAFIESKVGWVAAFNIAWCLVCIIGASLESPVVFLLAYILVMFSVAILLTLYKFGRKQINSLISTAAIFYLYITGRSIAMLDKLFDLVRLKRLMSFITS